MPMNQYEVKQTNGEVIKVLATSYAITALNCVQFFNYNTGACNMSAQVATICNVDSVRTTVYE